MGISLTSNFTVNAALPLDDRMQVADNTARDAIDAGRRYEGLIVYSIGAGTNYQLVGGITNGDWTELAGGGGGGTTVIVERFNGDAATVAFALANDPIAEENTQVYVNGVYQQKDTYSVSGLTITFTGAPPIGTGNIEVTYFTAFSVSSLPVGSVDTADLADGAITNEKIADDTITLLKLAPRSYVLTTATSTQIAYSASSGTFLLTTGGVTDVTNLTVTITTNGGPVEIWLEPEASSSSSVVGMIQFSRLTDRMIVDIITARDGTRIASQQFESRAVGATQVRLGLPCSSYRHIDLGVVGFPGTYVYKIQTELLFTTSSPSVNFYYTRLFAKEL